MYEHITDGTAHADAQTLDVATEQQQQQHVVGKPEEEADDGVDEDDDVKMADDKEEVKWSVFSSSTLFPSPPFISFHSLSLFGLVRIPEVPLCSWQGYKPSVNTINTNSSGIELNY